MILKGFGFVIFFLLVWAAGVFTQYRYWSKVRRMIHEIAKDHEGYLGTGMCKISFARKAFVLVLTDTSKTITQCYELVGLSLWPRFQEIPGTEQLPLRNIYECMPSEKYRGAFQQAIVAIDCPDKDEGAGAQNALMDGVAEANE